MDSDSELFSSSEEIVDKSEVQMITDTENDNTNVSNQQVKNDLEYAELDPELYGLRRSGRGNTKHEFKVIFFYYYISSMETNSLGICRRRRVRC